MNTIQRFSCVGNPFIHSFDVAGRSYGPGSNLKAAKFLSNQGEIFLGERRLRKFFDNREANKKINRWDPSSMRKYKDK